MSGDTQSGGYFMRDRNRVSGPFDVETLKRFARSQRLARHHQLSTDRMTWARAADLLPEVFAAHVNVPQREQVDAAPPPPEDEFTQLDQSDSSSATVILTESQPGAVPWGLIAALTAVIGGGGAVAVLVWLSLGLADSRWSARDVQNAIAPMLTVVRGAQTKGGKATCYGVVVSRHHVVVPFIAATFRAPKVESEESKGDREWHSARLVLVDPVSNLAVLRADLGQPVNVIDIPEDRSLPRVHDDLYVVAPDRRGLEVVCRAELDEVAARGEPEQMLLLSFSDEMPDADELLGRAVIDEEGRFVGLVVGATPDGRAVCAAGNEVRIKRNEAKKLPADHALEPIGDDEADAETSWAGEGTTAKESPSRQAHSRGEGRKSSDDEEAADPQPEPDQPGGSPSPRQKSPRTSGAATDGDEPRLSSGQDVIGTLGKAGASVVSGVTNVMTPQIPDTTAEMLGRNHLEKILAAHPPCRDKAVVARVHRLCDEMLRAAEEDQSRYAVMVVEDSTVNAYAFVGRNLVVTTGFMEFAAQDDDMICFVIAHEIGHVVLGHADEPYRRLAAVDGLGPGGEVAAGLAQAVFKNSPMNQAQEKAADCFAVSCLRRAGRPIEGGVRFFEKIVTEGDETSSGDAIGALFSSHPDSRQRIEQLRKGCGRADE